MDYLSKKELTSLAINAQFLFEVSKESSIFDPTQWKTKKHIRRWCERAAKADREVFTNRLDWADMTLIDAQKLVQTPDISIEDSLPDWVETLEEMLLEFGRYNIQHILSHPSDYDSINREPSKPFDHLFIPFTEYAARQITQKISIQSVSPAAFANLKAWLVDRLSMLCARVLYFEFSLYRRDHMPAFTTNVQNLQGNAIYQSYIKYLWSGGFKDLLLKYPVLARIIVTAVKQWIANHGELFSRLAKDREQISGSFKVDIISTEVVEIKTGLSDPHNGGHTVAILTFANEFKLVYKPRSMQVETIFNSIINWINAESDLPHYKNIHMLCPGNYGWVEFIEFRSCKTEEQIGRYYTRAGMLVALLYLFQGTDVHRGNIKACGEHPMLIDGETIMQPSVRPFMAGPDEPRLPALKAIKQSALRSLLLPQWLPGLDGEAYELSGLTSGLEKASHFNQLQWSNPNTDAMKQVFRPMHFDFEIENLPRLNDAIVSAETYITTIVDGFSRTMRFFLEQKDDLLKPESIITPLKDVEVRFIMRNTRVYMSLHEHTLQPRFLQDGVAWGIEIDSLSRSYVFGPKKPNYWPMLMAETEAMYKLDIPYFTVGTNTKEFPDGVTDYLMGPSYPELLKRIETLDESDIEFQVGIIHGSFSTRYEVDYPHPLEPLAIPRAIDKQDLIERSILIGEEIQKQAFINSEGDGLSWLGFDLFEGSTKLHFNTAPDCLQNGVGGIGLFLAALSVATGRDDFAYDAIRAFRSTANTYIHHVENITSHTKLDIGGSFGLGSIVYTATKVSQLLNNNYLRDLACAVAYQITFERIQSDNKLDVMFGSAGTILGLMPLYVETQDDLLLRKMIACGDNLLEKRVESENGLRAWALNGSILAGFSHGAAGNALALLRLYKVTNEKRFLDAALEAIAYENTLLDESVGNWNYLLGGTIEQPSYVNRWCHGAPGIGLARIGGLDVLDTPEIRRNIEIAVTTSAESRLALTDHICCGNLGIFETLLSAETTTPHLNPSKALNFKLSQMLQRADRRGQYVLPSTSWKHPFQIGIFQGTSGVGYQLLRIAMPNKIPSLLLWE